MPRSALERPRGRGAQTVCSLRPKDVRTVDRALRLRTTARERPDADADDQQRALKQELVVGGEPDQRDGVEADADREHADERSHDVELAVAQDGRSEEAGRECR